jgi:hypothetical protein
MRRADAESACDGASEVGDHAATVFDVTQDGFGARQQFAPGLGEADATTDAVKQRCVQFSFQRGDAFAHRRLGEIKLFCGEGKRFPLGGGDKGL